MALDFTKFPVSDPAEQARLAAERQAERDGRLVLTARAIAEALPYKSEGQVARAAQWACQWLPEHVWSAFDHSDYIIPDDIRETLTAYRMTLEQV